ESGARVHFRRMLWLLLFGYLHYYLIWFGDILTGYATIGLIAWFFHAASPKKLLIWGGVFVAIQFLLFAAMAVSFQYMSETAAAPGASAETVKQWAEMQRGFAIPSDADLARSLTLYRGGWLDLARHQLVDKTFEPLIMLAVFGWETLGYMLLGMAALKTGFFTGSWSDALYRKIALIGFAITIPAYSLLAWLLWSDGFTPGMMPTFAFAGPVLFRPLMVIATAALIILLTRRGGALVERIAAAGRAAFTNYLGTSILMTTLFYGYGGGLFGTMGRAELWLVVLAMWALMLLWSKPWLDRYRYGPFEWLWRSLARGGAQPMRKTAVEGGLAA
ncbi:MAG TPA: DUF418 domain-containing protein, partial [Allosphingosinicella sp.]